MSDPMFVLLSATLKFGLVFYIGIRELVLLRRLRDRDERDPGEEQAPLPLLPDAGTGPVRKLPDCLIPRPIASPEHPVVREHEPA